MSIQAMALSFLHTASSTSATTLERRFGLSSAQIGMFGSMRRAISLLFLIPIAHYANRGAFVVGRVCESATGHKGRWIAWSCVLIATGALIVASAQFIGEPYNVQTRRAPTTGRGVFNTTSTLIGFNDVRRLKSTQDDENAQGESSGQARHGPASRTPPNCHATCRQSMPHYIVKSF
jgi:hypothetical protein